MSNQDSLVSVIVTSYNYARYIDQTISSIISQTHENWELIICDDGSTDNSLEVIRSFNDPRITLIASDKHQGIGPTVNEAYALCKGKYIAGIDADDCISQTKFEKQVQFMEGHPEIDICGTFVSEVDAQNNPFNDKHEAWFNVELDLNDPESWIWQNRLCYSTVFMKKSMRDLAGEFNNDLMYAPDYEFWSRCLAKGAKFHVMHEKLTYYRNHGENITNKNPTCVFLEFAYIGAKILQPYFVQIGRVDLAIKYYKTFLFHDYYPSDTIKQQNLLRLLSGQSLEMTFNEIWKRFDVPAQLLTYNLVINALRDDAVTQEGHIKEFRRELKDKNEKLAERDQQLANHKKQIEDLLNSYSWRITAPLRSPGYLLRKIGSKPTK